MRIGVLTGGGDCPGLNAVIRAVVRTCDSRYGSTVVGFQDGWRGLLENRRVQLANDDRNDRLLAKGGTMLGTARVNPDKLRAGLDQVKATLDDNGIDVLIPIGGEGTLTAAHWLSQENVPVVGVPKTIDNDIDCTDVTFGHDTALQVATEAIDRLHSTAESHQRVMLVEVMGRHAGWIALNAGLASGAHMTLIPEQPFDVEEVCRLVKQRFQHGSSHFICVVAEGAKPAEGSMELRSGGIDEFGHERFTGVAAQLAVEIERRVKKDVRTTVLGHVQRGGTPDSHNRVRYTPVRRAARRRAARRHVNGIPAQDIQRNHVEGAFMGGGEHHRSGTTITVRPKPIHRGDTPAVTGRQARKPIGGHRRGQIIADRALVLEELGGDHRANGMQSNVFRARRTAAVPVETGNRVTAARL
ncbi:6-phosphofructokinase [Mycolicibacter terrae]|uniref:ATP-dependent 6-phosphofructokinase n=1 Tax=Mycolicibacter terrae TaxID=1788 RepID=A0AAD1HUY8_9MYCO|nr:6-phosphofructokinase [Mycolicibacter terrae]